jgi:hypothetical protein
MTQSDGKEKEDERRIEKGRGEKGDGESPWAV